MRQPETDNPSSKKMKEGPFKNSRVEGSRLCHKMIGGGLTKYHVPFSQNLKQKSLGTNAVFFKQGDVTPCLSVAKFISVCHRESS